MHLLTLSINSILTKSSLKKFLIRHHRMMNILEHEKINIIFGSLVLY